MQPRDQHHQQHGGRHAPRVERQGGSNEADADTEGKDYPAAGLGPARDEGAVAIPATAAPSTAGRSGPDAGGARAGAGAPPPARPRQPGHCLSHLLPDVEGGQCLAACLTRQMVHLNSRGTKRPPNQWNSRLLSAQVAGSSPAGGTGGRRDERLGPRREHTRHMRYTAVVAPTERWSVLPGQAQGRAEIYHSGGVQIVSEWSARADRAVRRAAAPQGAAGRR
jgi:hypothetical protein